MPVDMDPSGIVGKIEHVVRLQDDRMRDEIRRMAPEADPVQVSVAQNILEVATSLNQSLQDSSPLLHSGTENKKLLHPCSAADDNADASYRKQTRW